MSELHAAGLTSVRVQTERAEVHVLTRPGPRPVVFVHGLSASSLFFVDAAERPELAGRGLVLVDLPGFGHSRPSEDFGYTMPEQSRAVAETFERLGVVDATLVGHSMGGTIAILAVDRLASRISRLVLAEAVLLHDDSIWTAQIARMPFADWDAAFDGIQKRPEVWARGGMLRRRGHAVRQVAPAILHTSARAMHRSAVELHRESADPLLYQRFLAIPTPFEYVFGDVHDNTQFCARVCADGVAHRFVTRAGHLMMLDNPDEFYAIVAEDAGPEGSERR